MEALDQGIQRRSHQGCVGSASGLVKVFAETLFVGRAARFVPAAQQPQSLHGKQGSRQGRRVLPGFESLSHLFEADFLGGLAVHP